MNKPVIIIGHGVRIAGCADKASKLLRLNAPVISSWLGADIVDNFDQMYFGRPGVFGWRSANRIFYEADTIISVGCRMCSYMIGHAGLRMDQVLLSVDCDDHEATRLGGRLIDRDIGKFIDAVEPFEDTEEWLEMCKGWRTPLVEPVHADTNGYVNSYRIAHHLQGYLRPDEIIYIDDGCNLCPIFQVMRFKPPQRVITSGGLGEMGCGLPGAIGASFAGGKREVILVNGDGGMMLNIQELATVANHKLPIKIILFENDGYGMIKGTYTNMKMERVGVDRNSGLKLPDFEEVARAFGIRSRSANTWDEINSGLNEMFMHKGPFLLQIHIDPEQAYFPKLQPIFHPDGRIEPAKFHQLSPL